MESIWTKTTDYPSFASLDRALSVDVAIVGGGLAGILTAYFLTNNGLSVAILEQGHIGHGKTGHTTAKITSQHGLIYTKLLQQLGREQARQYACTQQKAVSLYGKIIAREEIACDFSRRNAYLYSTTHTDLLKKETESALKLGLPAAFTTEHELPFSVAGAVKFENQAQFHPLKFLYSIANKLTRSDASSSSPTGDTKPSDVQRSGDNCVCQIFEHSQVTTIKDHTLSVRSSQGEFSVRANHIVLTSGFPIKDIPGFYFARQHQELSYLLALDHAHPMEGMYYSIDPSGHTFRSHDGLLLFGGLGHRTGKLQPGDAYRRLWNTARQWYPKAACVAHWSNEDAVPHDHVPFIGQFSLWMPQVYVATGFQKWGMTGSMTAAAALSDLILGREDDSYRVYRPQRMSLAGAGPFFADLGHSILHLVLQKPFAPKEKQKAIDKGFGPTCTHLGCTLSWNPADRTWDCPCHGSRYTEDGERIAGPACECLSMSKN